MRFFVEVTSIGKVEPDTLCVEADSWQRALQFARTMRGDEGTMSGFAVEVRGEGCRAVDPIAHLRFDVARAPNDAPLTVPSSPPPAGAVTPPRPAPHIAHVSAPPAPKPSTAPPTGVTASPVPHVASPPTSAPRPASAAAAASGENRHDPPSGNGSTEPAAMATMTTELQLLFKREEEPTATAPIAYREYVYALSPGTNEDAAAAVLRTQFEVIKSTLAPLPAGKLVNLAAFDAVFQGKPPGPPLATLTWKDWRGDAVLSFPRRGGGAPVSMRPPRTVSFEPPPPPSSIPASHQPQAHPQPPLPLASAPAVSTAPPSGPVSHTTSIPPPPAFVMAAANAAHGVTEAAAPTPEAVESAGRAGDPARGAPFAASARPAEDAVFAPVFAPDPAARAPERAGSPIMHAAPFPIDPLTALGANMDPPPHGPVASPPLVSSLASPSDSSQSSVPASPPEAAPIASPGEAAAIPPRPPSRPGSASRFRNPQRSEPRITGGRSAGDDLITDLFEAMHDLHFLSNALEGAEFCLALALEKLPSRAAFVHFYDINRREFVVASTKGKGTSALLLDRHAESDPILASAMKKRRAVVIADAAGSEAESLGRFAAIAAVKSVIVAPVMQAGRFLGAIELLNPLDGAPFTDGDGDALSYIGEQFAEYLSSRGVILDAELIARAGAEAARAQ